MGSQMSRDRKVSSAQQGFTFTRRAMFIGGVQSVFGLVLAGRMAYISVAENEKYKLQAESNRVNLTLIPPRRGWFVDRNGKPMATNRADFRVDIIPDRMVDKEATVATLAKLLALTQDDVDRINRELKQDRGFQPIQVAAGLDYNSYSKVSVRLPELPGVSPRQGFSRFYPDGAAVGHLLGYVGAVSSEEYQEDKNPLLITPGFKIGKDGLEKFYEKNLQGTAGAKRVEVTARGKIVRELTTRTDIPGRPVHLCIDADLQTYAARRLGLESGSVVVLDCLSGDILAMASMPSFDPNSFSDGIGAAEYKWLSQNDHVPLRNKTLSGLYPPGSTIKPMNAMAFLEAGLDPNATVQCGGGLRVGNRVFHCWNRRGHGTVNMAKAIYQSCDVYFYHFAQKMGSDVISKMAQRLGLGQKFDLQVASQSYGTVPFPAWKEKKYNQKWGVADTVNSSIGQGYFLTNPAQLAVMAARLATGKDLQPHLILNKNRPAPKLLGFSDEHINYVRQAMSDVVNGPGTAGKARLPIADVKMAGKTGTAQVVSLDKGRGKGGLWKYRDHGLFIFFAPFDNPRYAGAVVIEHGGGSGAAYPIARDVMTFLYDREKAMNALRGFESGWGGDIETRMARGLASFQGKMDVPVATPNAALAPLNERPANEQPASEPGGRE
jgi:penicillin-binding protein 2